MMMILKAVGVAMVALATVVVAQNPTINSQNGNIVMAVQDGNNVRFQVGSETIDATAIPASLRGCM